MYVMIFVLSIASGGHWHSFEARGHEHFGYSDQCTSALATELASLKAHKRGAVKLKGGRCVIDSAVSA